MFKIQMKKMATLETTIIRGNNNKKKVIKLLTLAIY